MPAVEIMIATGLIRDCIREADKTPQIPSVIAAGTAQYGMQTFDQSLLQLYREELITYETARDAATNPDDFDLKVKGIFSTGEMTWEHPGGSNTASTAAPTQPGMAPAPVAAARSPFGKKSGASLDAARRPALDAKAARLAAFDLLGPQVVERPRADRAASGAAALPPRSPGRGRRAHRTRLRRRRRPSPAGGPRPAPAGAGSAAIACARSCSPRAFPARLAEAAIAAAFEEVARTRARARGRPAPAARPPARAAPRARRPAWPTISCAAATRPRRCATRSRVLLAERGADLAGTEDGGV